MDVFSFSFANLAIAGVGIAALVAGLTQFLKEIFNLEGKAVNILAVGLGALFVVVSEVQPLLPQTYATILNIVVLALAGGLSAGGYYQMVNSFVAKSRCPYIEKSPDSLG